MLSHVRTREIHPHPSLSQRAYEPAGILRSSRTIVGYGSTEDVKDAPTVLLADFTIRDKRLHQFVHASREISALSKTRTRFNISQMKGTQVAYISPKFPRRM
jgi:hypothetical protein